jgi:hypothetical protein
MPSKAVFGGYIGMGVLSKASKPWQYTFKTPALRALSLK